MIQLRHCRSIFVHCVGLIYAILYEDNRALYLARADENDGIVRLIDALDDAALERAARVCDDLREAFRGKKRLEILAHFVNRQLGARKMATRRALIIGGSVGGLFAAHMLGRTAGRSTCTCAVARNRWPCE